MEPSRAVLSRWRPGWRFSLRSLVLLVLVAAIGLGIYSWGLRRARRQAPAVETLRNYGATIVYDYGGKFPGVVNGPRQPISEPSPFPERLVSLLGIDHFHDVTEVDCQSANRFSPEDAKDFWDAIAKLPQLTRLHVSGGMTQPGNLQKLSQLDRLESLSLRWSSAAPGDYSALQTLPRLEHLDLSDAEIGDEHVQFIAAAPTLKMIDLHHAKITDEALKSLAGMPQLQRLWLSGTKVGDDGIKHLRGHPSLVDLDLGYTAITDVALADLATIPNLDGLDVAATTVTDRGLACLEGHPRLSYLNLELAEVRGSGIVSLSRIPNLEELCIGGRHKLESAKMLAACQQLKRLKLWGFMLHMEELEQTDLPRVVELHGGYLNDDALSRLASSSKVKAIRVSWQNPYGLTERVSVAEFLALNPSCELIDDAGPSRGLRSRP